jgi:hypothetical protein
MNAPFDVFASPPYYDEGTSSGDSNVRVYWTDMSRIEDHFTIFYFQSQSPGDTARLFVSGNGNCPSGPDDECRKYYNQNHPSFSDHQQVTALEPDTEYCFRVRSEDHVGLANSEFGDGDFSCVRTLRESPQSPDDPGDKTATVWLENEEIIEGGAAYRGRIGPIVTGPPYLTKIQNVSGRGLLFVKAGRTTDECGSSSAVVGLAAGEEMTPSRFREIWGTAMPPLGPKSPLYFTACASGNVVDRLPIKISYRDMNSDGPPDTVPDQLRGRRSGR